ncbi:MAG: biopolymer transporter ExbD [Gammaproteobacteria bacterium]|nr:biopolymer transporter ExbD [Gammaproteobacteria bacterium]
MARRRHYRRTDKETPEMDITTFLNLMVVLVPFLLITAVFSRVTILELNLPTAAGSSAPTKIKLTIEVIVREKGLEIGNGRRVIARFPKVTGTPEVDAETGVVSEAKMVYDLKSLTEYLLKIKANYPDKTDVTVLMEPEIEYDYLIDVMDVVRSAEVKQGETDEVQKIALFPDISIGDAP